MPREISQAKLVSLGFGFYGPPSKDPADPERTILELLPTFFEDRKTFRILLRWLQTVSELIHIERLASLAKTLSVDEKAVLGAVALKMMNLGDRRWAMIEKQMKKGLKRHPANRPVPREYSDPFLMHKYGSDTEFFKFGFTTSTVAPEDEKKVLTLKGIIKSHPWLRLRTLIGPNYRADLAYLLSTSSAANPNQAAKILSCSRETAYRLWGLITMFEGTPFVLGTPPL